MLVGLHLHNETQNDTDFCCLTEGLKCCTVPLITRTRLDRVHSLPTDATTDDPRDHGWIVERMISMNMQGVSYEL